MEKKEEDFVIRVETLFMIFSLFWRKSSICYKGSGKQTYYLDYNITHVQEIHIKDQLIYLTR